MMFNLFGKKKFLKDLKNRGGMTTVYSTLINDIKAISQTWDNEFKVITEELNENTFAITIDFSRMKDSIIVYSDTFVLVEKPAKLKVDWKRHSQRKLPIIPSPLPAKINESFLFSKDQDQNKIFEKLVQNINDVLSKKYRFSDSHFQSIENSGNSRYISKEDRAKQESKMYDMMVQEAMKNRKKQ